MWEDKYMSRKWINKQTITMFIMGAIIFGSIAPIYATVEEYIFNVSDNKLLIDGERYANPDIKIPLFTYQDRNYAPIAVIRDICLKLNIPFEYDNTTKEIRITTTSLKTTQTSSTLNQSESITLADEENAAIADQEFRDSARKPKPTIDLPNGMEWELYKGKIYDIWVINNNGVIYMDKANASMEYGVNFKQKREIIGQEDTNLVLNGNPIKVPIIKTIDVIISKNENEYTYDKTDITKVITINNKEYYNSSWLLSLN
jgi:hypothetical protein